MFVILPKESTFCAHTQPADGSACVPPLVYQTRCKNFEPGLVIVFLPPGIIVKAKKPFDRNLVGVRSSSWEENAKCSKC